MRLAAGGLRAFALLALCLLAGIAARPAQAADDAAELAFWASVRDTRSPAELQAYLDTFPAGRFAELARIRLRSMDAVPGAAVPVPTQEPASVQNFSPTAPALMSNVSVTPARRTISVLESLAVDIDARGLRDGSNQRVAIMAADTPVAIADGTAFARESRGVAASRMRVTLSAVAAGNGEVRLYYIPAFESRFVLAARAPVAILAGTPGALPVAALTREAEALGPIRFEARYRDTPTLIEGQFLRAQPRSAGEVEWASLLRTAIAVDRPYIAIFLGQKGIERRTDAPTEALCLMRAESRDVLDAAASLNSGDIVRVRGTPSTWRNVFGTAAVILDPCIFAR